MSPRRALWRSAKRRAEQAGIPFDLDPEDIVIPQFCPVLGLDLVRGVGGAHDASPTLDRIVPAKGYVRGNVVVVSHRANRLKSDATIHELVRIARFYQQLSPDRRPAS